MKYGKNIVVIRMKKELKKDIFNLLLLIGAFFIVFFMVTKFEFWYGSTKDWQQQHWVIPEYFRTLFYETHDLFPDFALNLGSGQNIYNFAYYGYLNPVILVSYFLPFVSMQNYIVWSTVCLVLLSVVLMYFFIKKKTNSKTAFICSFIFLMATPLIYHSHRHIMFMNYMPFLILGYYGVDKYFEDKKLWLLSLSVFLMIMTSYFYSVSGIVSIIIYGIYCYVKRKERVTINSFIKDGILFLLPILVGVLMACILIVPTFYSLLAGRGESDVIVNVVKLFIPDLILKNLLYSSYSAGLSSIAFVALVASFFGKKEEKTAGVLLSIVFFVPIVIYLLNGFLYVDAKVLITFIPMFIVLISNLLSKIVENKINYRLVAFLSVFIAGIGIYFNGFSFVVPFLCDFPLVLLSLFLVLKKKNLNYIAVLLLPVLLIFSVSMNDDDNLVLKTDVIDHSEEVQYILENDEDFYRLGVYDNDLDSVNKIYDINHYSSSIYSSSSSINYKDYFYNRLGNEIIFRSHGMINTTNNIFNNIYLGNKYIISNNFDSYLYDEIDEDVYKNEYVLPVGYATDRLMSLSYYNSLSFPDNLYAYLNYTIVDNDDFIVDFESLFRKVALDYSVISSDIESEFKDEHYIIRAKEKDEVNLVINTDLKDKILLISFDMNYQERCGVGDTSITINGIKNKITCRTWKYQNKNSHFEYVISEENINDLNIVFSKGKFDISNIEFYVIDYSDIYDIVGGVDPFVIDKDKTSGDTIYGEIDVTKTGYFNLSIPHDKGFNIYVDGKKVEYEKVDVNFIGFEIEKGHHTIEIEYKSPFKSIGIVLSIIGIILFLLEVFMVTILNLVGSLINEIVNPKTKLFKWGMGLYHKYKEIFNYLVVGCLTTAVSLGTKWGLLFTVLDADDAFELQVSIIVSWICAVLFAYVANRIFVFNSKNKNILKEMFSFFGARILTLVMEMVIMWFFITLLRLNSDTWVVIWTFVTQVLIMVFNYIFSKLFVFKKK